jgi:hypothetical protein
MPTRHTNNDGLVRQYGLRDAETNIPREGNTDGHVKQLVVHFGASNLPGFDKDAGGGSTPDSFSDAAPHIPAGAWIKSATVIVKTAFTIGAADTIDIGLYQQGGTAIDDDGIDSAVAAAALADNLAVVCDGALVGGTAGVGANDAYLKIIANADDANITAGDALLVIEYIEAR